MAAIVAKEHHEKWDGTGYPDKKVGEEIHIYGRITAVADVFDALTTARPYKNSWINEKSIDWILSKKGEDFDEKVVEAFEKSLFTILEIQKELRD